MKHPHNQSDSYFKLSLITFLPNLLNTSDCLSVHTIIANFLLRCCNNFIFDVFHYNPLPPRPYPLLPCFPSLSNKGKFIFLSRLHFPLPSTPSFSCNEDIAINDIFSLSLSLL